MFGFSRGAFTVRSLAGMICRCGLLEREAIVRTTRRTRKHDVKRILHAYRSEKAISSGASADRIRKALGIDDLSLRSVEIHFVGVWDTVDAVGVPFDALKEWVDPVWRCFRKRRLWGFHDPKPHPAIRHAYQALALDDERRTFHPLVWKVSNLEPQDPAGPMDSNESDTSCEAGDDGKKQGERIARPTDYYAPKALRPDRFTVVPNDVRIERD